MAGCTRHFPSITRIRVSGAMLSDGHIKFQVTLMSLLSNEAEINNEGDIIAQQCRDC